MKTETDRPGQSERWICGQCGTINTEYRPYPVNAECENCGHGQDFGAAHYYDELSEPAIAAFDAYRIAVAFIEGNMVDCQEKRAKLTLARIALDDTIEGIK